MPTNTDPWAAIQQELDHLRSEVRALRGPPTFADPNPWEARYGHYHMDPPVPMTPKKPRTRVTMKTPPEDLTWEELVAYVKRLRRKIVSFESGLRSGPG